MCLGVVGSCFWGRGMVKSAVAAPNDATIFTGQIIPAFIGGAYDPTEAFKKLAGLPIYVVAYDNWGQANKIKNNLAIRTQIRADGTFQAAGLPTAAHYGVYFPFRKGGAHGAQRTDGLTGGVQTAEFRWPELADKIIDVFSYSFVDGSGITVKDQLGNDVQLGQLFTTTTTRVDKENNINVFPVVPVSTLKVTVGDHPDASYEVYAQRIARPVTDPQAARYSQISPILNYPIVRGRTSPGPGPDADNAVHTFQAYAPEGYYVIIVWRTEGNSATYKDWDGKSPLNSSRHGMATARVDDDWQEALGKSNRVPALGRVLLWGVVTNSRGALMTRLTQGLEDLQVGVSTYRGLPFRGRVASRNPNLDFYTPASTAKTDTTVWGIYMLAESILNNEDHSLEADSTCVYINNAGYRADPVRPDRGIVYGVDGPVRVDLQASKSRQGHASGYDQGVILRVTDKEGNPLRGALVRVGTTKEAQERFDIPALTKTYTTNCVGEVYIPDSHLAREQSYVLELRSGRHFAYHYFTYPASGYYDNNGAAIVLEELSPTAVSANKILGLFPWSGSNVLASAPSVAIKGTILTGEDLSGYSVVFYSLAGNRFESGGIVGECPPESCYVDNDGVKSPPSPFVPQGLTDEFKIILPVPPTPDEVRQACESAGWGWDRLKTLNCAIFNNRAANTVSYQMEISARRTNAKPDEAAEVFRTYNLTVRNDGVSVTYTPAVMVDFSLNCEDRFPFGLKEKATLNVGRLINLSACKFGKMFIEKSTALMDAVQYWLFIRPLTQEGGVVKLWDTVRNIANVVFVLILVAIGLASILGYEPESWSPAILLPRLLVAIVVANFSLLLVQGLIDLTNVLTNTVFSITQKVLALTAPEEAGRVIVGAAGVAAGALAARALLAVFAAKLSAMGVSMLLSVIGVSVNPVFIMPLLSVAIGFFFTILLFLIGLVILFYARYFAIWAMVVAAPAIWAAQVIPSNLMQTFRQKWWSTLLAFTFMQPLIAATLSLGLLLLTVVGADHTLLGGFGIAVMGIITLGAVFKVPGMMNMLVGEGFVSTQGLGQAPEGLREKIFGKEGWMEEKFSAENLAKYYQTAKARRSRVPIIQGLYGAIRGSLEQEEEYNKLLEVRGVPSTKRPQERAQRLRETNLILKSKGAVAAGVRELSSVGEREQLETVLKAASPRSPLRWINPTTGNVERGTVGEYLERFVDSQTGKMTSKSWDQAVAELHSMQEGYSVMREGPAADAAQVAEAKRAYAENMNLLRKEAHATSLPKE